LYNSFLHASAATAAVTEENAKWIAPNTSVVRDDHEGDDDDNDERYANADRSPGNDVGRAAAQAEQRRMHGKNWGPSQNSILTWSKCK